MNNGFVNGLQNGLDVVDEVEEARERDEASEGSNDSFNESDARSGSPEPGSEQALEFCGFDPPLYKQRYSSVLEILQDERWILAMSRVVDVGCAECKFIKHLQKLPRVREIVGVDISEQDLDYGAKVVEPLFVDFLQPRPETKLEIHLMLGSIAQVDSRLIGIDAVTAIEVIEHMHPDILEAFMESVFAHMKPKIAIFTTPNQEYNVLFPNFEGPFRHCDHKFEWTRSQFQNWACGVEEKYPDYQIERFDGVGPGPGSIGHCSQLVVFVRKEFFDEAKNGVFDQITLDEDDLAASQRNFVENSPAEGVYRIMTSYAFPMRREHRSREEIIFDEAQYYLQMLAAGSEEWANEEPHLMKMEDLLTFDKLKNLNVNLEELEHVLRNGGYDFDLVNNCLCVLVPFQQESSSSSECDPDDDDGEEVHEAAYNLEEEEWD